MGTTLNRFTILMSLALTISSTRIHLLINRKSTRAMEPKIKLKTTGLKRKKYTMWINRSLFLNPIKQAAMVILFTSSKEQMRKVNLKLRGDSKSLRPLENASLKGFLVSSSRLFRKRSWTIRAKTYSKNEHTYWTGSLECFQRITRFGILMRFRNSPDLSKMLFKL